MYFFSLKEKVLVLKAFLLERKFDFRESFSLGSNDLLFPTWGVIVISLRMTFSRW